MSDPDYYLSDELYLGSFCKSCGRPTGKHGEDVDSCSACAAPPSPAEKLSCTGWAASWCPVCGDCSCERHPDGERIEPPLETCALHGERSTHAGSEPFDPSNQLGIPDWARD